MAKLPHEILAEVNQKKTKVEKIKVLKKHQDNWALKDIIRGSMDSKIQWLLPQGAPPPYTPAESHTCPSSILREHKKFAYFAKGGKGVNLHSLKRENMFISVLESIDPNDSELLIDMINKRTPKGLTRPIVEEAFPGLLKD